jgi:pantothenate kinase
MDKTYEALAKHAIEKLNLVRKQQQQQQQDNDNTNNARPHQRHRRRRLWIGLAGGPGSGKSTVADAVAERINKIMDNNVTLVLPMDGFHYTQAYLKEHNMDMKRRGAPWTFDAKTMYEKLHDVTAHHSNDHNSDDADQQQQDPTSFWFPLYNRDISDPVENAICINDSHDIIIVEGLYMLFGALGEQAQDPESPLMQTIQKKFPAGKWPSSPEQHPTLFCSIQEEIAKWKPITELLDETWYVEAPRGLPEQEQRLIQRSLQTWTSAKTKLWGGGDDDDTKVTAEQAATNRVQYNDTPNGQLIECCRPYADRVIETR